MTFKFDMSALVPAQLAAAGFRLDTDLSAAFTRELEYVHAEVIAAKYPDLKWRNVVPVKTGAPLGATAHRWFEIDGYGDAKYLDNMATGDFPTAEVKGDEQTGKIRSIGAKYQVTVEDLRAAALMRVNVETEKARLAKRAIEALIDKTVFGPAYNKSIGGFTGLCNDANSTAYTPDATLGSNGHWSPAVVNTPEKIIYDIRNMIDTSFLAVKAAFQQWDLFLPPELGVLLGAPMSLANGSDPRIFLNMSIGAYALANIPRLRSISVDNFRLSGVGPSGAHRALAYPRDPEVLDFFLPLEIEQFAPQLSGMSFVTHMHAKVGGLRIKHPKAIMRVDLVTT